MPTDEAPNELAKNPDQLTGWKEIASYLDKAVRTAQRWEPELALPVHRIRIRGTETVFAFRSELDAWRVATELRRAADLSEGTDAAGDSAPDTRDSTDGIDNPSGSCPAPAPAMIPRRRWSRPAIWSLIAVVGVIAAVFFEISWRWVLSPGADSTPAKWKVDEAGFHVSNAAGVVLWSKTFGFKLSETGYPTPESALGTPPVQIRDIDGDGGQEVLFVTMPVSTEPLSVLYCFGADGIERWRHQVTRTINYGSHGSLTPLRVHNPPFRTTRLWVLDVGARLPEVWASARHHQEFPMVLQRLDPAAGHVLQEYWSSGDIWTLTTGILGGQRRYFVGGAKNEGRQGSLAVFGSGGPRGVAPAEDPYYACQNCGTGQPLMTFAFPQTEIARLYETFPIVEMTSVASNDLWVTVRQNTGFEKQDHFPFQPATAAYHLDSSLRLVEAELQAPYVAVHRRLEQTRLLDHTFSRAEDRQLWPVGRWDGRRWVEIAGPETSIR